ncbi:MAG: phosphoribosylanthranilate isomerase [Pseudomonadota bacterium]
MQTGGCRTKICCIGTEKELAIAARLGANLIGLVGPMPSGPGTITLAAAARVARTCPQQVTSVLLSAAHSAEDLIAEIRLVQPGAIQIVRQLAPEVHDLLATEVPTIQRIQVIHVDGTRAVEQISTYGDKPDAFLLDSGRPKDDELGGTGRVHDWAISRACVEAAARPVFLAGGLHSENVGDAIRQVRPHGIDVCSGVRTNGNLDDAKLSTFMAAIRGAE